MPGAGVPVHGMGHYQSSRVSRAQSDLAIRRQQLKKQKDHQAYLDACKSLGMEPVKE